MFTTLQTTLPFLTVESPRSPPSELDTFSSISAGKNQGTLEHLPLSSLVALICHLVAQPPMGSQGCDFGTGIKWFNFLGDKKPTETKQGGSRIRICIYAYIYIYWVFQNRLSVQGHRVQGREFFCFSPSTIN